MKPNIKRAVRLPKWAAQRESENDHHLQSEALWLWSLPLKPSSLASKLIYMSDAVRETADTVYATFCRLKTKEREAVIERLLKDRQFRENLLDIATIEQRRGEPGRPLRDYLASRKGK